MMSMTLRAVILSGSSIAWIDNPSMSAAVRAASSAQSRSRWQLCVGDGLLEQAAEKCVPFAVASALKSRESRVADGASPEAHPDRHLALALGADGKNLLDRGVQGREPPQAGSRARDSFDLLAVQQAERGDEHVLFVLEVVGDHPGRIAGFGGYLPDARPGRSRREP